MTKQLEDVLRGIQHTLTAAGAAEAAEGLSAVITAAAFAAELQAALERGDMEAAEFHSEVLERQVAVLPPLEFRIEE